MSEGQASAQLKKQEIPTFSPFLMNIDSLVNNAFFLSTSQRNPYKLASNKRKNDVTATKEDLKVIAKKHPNIHPKASSPVSRRSNVLLDRNKYQTDIDNRDVELIMAPSVPEIKDPLHEHSPVGGSIHQEIKEVVSNEPVVADNH